MQTHRFDDPAVLADALARSIAETLERALAECDVATLVVSGGSTPVPFFEALRSRPLAWERVQVTLADERWLPVDHERSNERLVRRHLLVGAAAGAQLFGLKNDHESPEEGVAACGSSLERLPRPFDAVVLGMGDDGHFASLFPRAAATAQGLDPSSPEPCLAVRPPGLEPRMSLSLSTLLESRRLVLHITGEEKRRILIAAEGDRDCDLPIAHLLRAAPKIELFWAP